MKTFVSSVVGPVIGNDEEPLDNFRRVRAGNGTTGRKDGTVKLRGLLIDGAKKLVDIHPWC